jgi:hypothetical protein
MKDNPLPKGKIIAKEKKILIIFKNLLLQNQQANFNEMKKITNSIQYHKSYGKYKSENGRTRTSEYIRGGIRCHGGVSIILR